MRASAPLPLAPDHAADGPIGWSALEQARRIREGDITSSELVDAYLARIRATNPKITAFTTVLERRARREAARADADRARGVHHGPFHGVPVAVKDHHFVRFTRARIGSHAFSWLWTPMDDDVVKRLRAAGFVLIGKTTMSELGILPIVEPDIHPPTRNPWNPEHTAGGSSGGAGAAVAAGLLPVAPGSDGAGSIRIPAALNGLLGHKPSRGLVPDPRGLDKRYDLSVIGPLARTAEDAAALLDVLAKVDDSRHARGVVANPEPLRIGVVREAPVGDVDPDLLAALDDAVAKLVDAGHHVEEREPPRAALDEFLPLYQRFIYRVPVLRPNAVQPLTKWFRDSGAATSDDDAMAVAAKYTDLGQRSMDGVDVLLTPTTAMKAPKVGAYAHLPPRELFGAISPLGAFTAVANITGDPAITVPMGVVDGLPVGVQLMGRHGDDARLLALARVLLAA